MTVENIAQTISTLTPDQQEVVLKFVEFLKVNGSAPGSPFLSAAEEFIDRHPELLRRLAQ